MHTAACAHTAPRAIEKGDETPGRAKFTRMDRRVRRHLGPIFSFRQLVRRHSRAQKGACSAAAARLRKQRAFVNSAGAKIPAPVLLFSLPRSGLMV